MTTLRTEQALRSAAPDVGKEVLAVPEDQWFERKSFKVSAKDLADAEIGFANAEGGTIVVGLWNGTIEGTDSDPKRRNDLMQAAMDHTEPAVRASTRLVPCVRDDGFSDHLLVVDVEPGDGLVYANRKDQAFLRIGDENRRLGFAQRQELYYDRGQGSFEARLSGDRTSDLDVAILDGYVEAARSTDPERLLVARGLARDGALTIAGSLLFGSRPQDVLPEAYVRVLRYQGRERGTGARQQLIEDHRVEGALPDQILGAQALVTRLQPRRRALGSEGRFGDVGLVPQDAWLEAIVNAVIHRSYSIAGDHIRVEIFDDRIEVGSPGRFPGIVAMAQPDKAPRYARNPRIARVLADLHFGQELGEGIKRMYEEMRLAGLQEPLYRQTAASVRVELSGDPVDRRLDSLLPSETREIVGSLRAADRLSTIEVARAIGLSRPVAIRRLQALREAGIVEWVGKSPKDPRAYWTLPR